MSTNLIIGIIAAVAVVGGGTYVAMNPEIIASITGGASMEEGEMNENGEGASVGNTFASILALGQNVECTFSHDDDAGNRSSGTVYIANGGTELAGEFNIEASASGPMLAQIIRTGGYNYIWGSFYPQGIKTKVVNEAELMTSDQGSIDPDTEFSCQAWVVDSSKFIVPTTVQFMEVNVNAGAGAGMTLPNGLGVPSGSVDASADIDVDAEASGSTGGTSGGTSGSVSGSGSTSGTSAQCASCNQLPEGAKEQCLAALSC